ncbi:MAG: YceI family protein [Fimbriimonadales bacterium]|nr:YceI family protein [Fimbriimonadales bacterium]
MNRTRKQQWIACLSVLALLIAPIEGAFAQRVNYQVDPVHSFVIFRVKHMNTAYAYGRFNSFSGTIAVDEKNPANSSVEFEIDANSVDTGNDRRDDHLRSPDFFNTRQHPKISFKSTSVRKLNDTTFEVKGNLTMRGITRPLTVRVTYVGKGRNPRGQEIIGFETTFTIKRSEFGVNYGLNGGLADDVRVTIAIEAIRQ